MLSFQEEKSIFQAGYKMVGGIDEAGRGPLAGPVVAACAIFPSDFDFGNKDLHRINDSKKLTAKAREELFNIISFYCPEVGVGICDHNTIDRINILQASFLAMKKAIGALKQKPDYLLIDGKFFIPNSSLPQKAIIKGDSLIFSIAAASIIAKVTRDRIMDKLHEQFPEYGFNQHKGYGTKKHFEIIKKLGPCPYHRKSFYPIKKRITCEDIKNKL